MDLRASVAAAGEQPTIIMICSTSSCGTAAAAEDGPEEPAAPGGTKGVLKSVRMRCDGSWERCEDEREEERKR